MSKRAERRHHNKRMWKKAYNKARLLNFSEDRCKQYANHYKDIATTCSCHMCGNPRKYFNKRTLQELKYY